MTKKGIGLEDVVMLQRTDLEDSGVTLFIATCPLQVRTATVTSTLINMDAKTRGILAKQIKDVFNGMLEQWRMGDIDPDRIPDMADNVRGVWITTPEVIDLFTLHGIPCDQATVSGLARQGRYISKKVAGAWVFDKQTVMEDIREVQKVRAAHDKKWMEV